MNEISAHTPSDETSPELMPAILCSLTELQIAVAAEMHRYLSEIVHAELQAVMAEKLGVPTADFIVGVISEGDSRYVADIQIIGSSLATLRQQLSDGDQRPKLIATMIELGRILRARLTTVFSVVEDSNAQFRFNLGDTDMGKPADFRIVQRFELNIQTKSFSAASIAVRSAAARLSLQGLINHRNERLDALQSRTSQELLGNKSALERVLKDKKGEQISLVNITTWADVDDEKVHLTVRLVLSGNPVGPDMLSDIARWVDQTLAVPQSDIWVEPPNMLSRLSQDVRAAVRPSTVPNPVVYTVFFERPR